MADAAINIRFIGPVVGRYTLQKRSYQGARVRVLACRLQSISPEMFVASAPVTGSPGEPVAAYFKPFGLLNGSISRHVDNGFCVDIDGTTAAKERLGRRILWYKKHVVVGLDDRREHERFMPREPRSTIITPSGTVLPCLIIDISGSGAAISADIDPPIGMPLALGTLVCRVVRKLEVGFAVMFQIPQEPQLVEDLVRSPEWARAEGIAEKVFDPDWVRIGERLSI